MQNDNVLYQRFLGAVLVILIVGSGMVVAQNIRPSIAETVIVDSQRIAELERRMMRLETGGSALASDTAARVTIADIRIASLLQEVHDIKSMLLGLAIYTVTHLVGFVIYLLKQRLFDKSHPRHV